MKIPFLINLFLLCNITYVFSEQIVRIDESNIYGGITNVVIFDENEQAQYNLIRQTQYFDSENRIVKMIATPTNEFIDETGMIEQTNHFSNNVLVYYEKHFSDQFKNIHGYNRLIEEVNANREIIRVTWYRNNTVLVTSDTIDPRFRFYNIEYVENQLLMVDNAHSETRNVIVSARYIHIMSEIRFGTDFFDLSDDDFRNMSIFAGILGAANFNHLYSKKVRVYSENKSYWLFLQTGSERHVFGQNATIIYYPIAYNGELILIYIGFSNIRE